MNYELKTEYFPVPFCLLTLPLREASHCQHWEAET